MIFSERQLAGSLELSRVVLASLAIWLAVTGLVTRDATAVSQASTAATAFVARAPSAKLEIASADKPPHVEAPEPGASAEPGHPHAAEVVRLRTGARTEFSRIRLRQAPTPAQRMYLPEPGQIPPQGLAAVDQQNPRSQAVVTTVARALAVAPAPFAFPADLGGQVLAERLVPPARFDVPAVPFVGQPEPWRGLRFDPLPRDIPPLTATIIPRSPQPVSHGESAGLTSSSFDLPNLPRDATATPIAPIRFSPEPRRFVPSADPNAIPRLPLSFAPPKEKPDPTFDPARLAAEVLLFAARGMTTAAPTAFIRLSIPEPFPQVREVQLTRPIVDLDAPSFPTGRPSAPVLHTAE